MEPTPYRQYSQQPKAPSLKQSFSHDFRTPLTFRNCILKRFVKGTFCLSFLFLCSPGAFSMFFFFQSVKSVFVCVCATLSDFSPVITYSPHCYNFIDSGSYCVFFRSYTGVKDNLSSECLFHSNGESGTPCQRYSLHRTKGQDPAIGLA